MYAYRCSLQTTTRWRVRGLESPGLLWWCCSRFLKFRLRWGPVCLWLSVLSALPFALPTTPIKAFTGKKLKKLFNTSTSKLLRLCNNWGDPKSYIKSQLWSIICLPKLQEDLLNILLAPGLARTSPQVDLCQSGTSSTIFAMAANYWESTQRRHWQYTREQLEDLRRDLEDEDQNLVQNYPLPQLRHLSIYFNQRKNMTTIDIKCSKLTCILQKLHG